MTIIELISNNILYISGVFFILFMIHTTIDRKREDMESSLIESLNNISQELDEGKSIESSIVAISVDKSNPASKYFKEIIEESKKGHSFEESLQIISKKTKSRTFAYICDIIFLAQNSKGNISDSLKKLSENLWEIDHLQTSINSKAAGPLTTLKLLGVALIPMLYYMMASALSSGNMIIEITLPFKVYFFAVGIAMNFADYFLFLFFSQGLYSLPFTITFISAVILKIGPYISNLFGG